jgi:1-acyl-sn-glycerol-3-phosphate acyltransferase
MAISHAAREQPPTEDPRTRALLALIQETLAELKHGASRAPRVTLDSTLDRDLGFDSLARVELVLRVERAFNVTVPESTLQIARTPRDLLAALEAGHSTKTSQQAVPRSSLSTATAEEEPADAATLVDVLEWHSTRHPERMQAMLLTDAGEEQLTYAQLKTGAQRVAAALQARALEPRQTVAIMLPTSLEYLYTYFGILLAGATPVPIYPPARMNQIEEHVRRHATILANARVTMLVTVPEARAVARLMEAYVPGLKHTLSVADLTSSAHPLSPVPSSHDDVAFIQYTSGSTGNPKGVVLTHANLLANIRAMVQALDASSRDVFVSWLPLYHDMGLIGAWLGSLYAGLPLVLMSPLAFLARPERWLWAIHRFRGTLSAAPNFAYELCLKRLDDAQLEGLDLSSWRLAFNGAEAVNPDTIRRFSERFARHGLSPTAMTPVYGLAEASVGLLFPPLNRGPVIDRIQREPFATRGKAVPAAADDAHPLRFVACGRPLGGHEVRIIDDTGFEVGDRVEGRLQFKGPSATQGYYRNPEATRQLFNGEWVDTGDRAYMVEGEVYVTGRVKDIIIRGGRNIYPSEIEEAVGALATVRKGCVAAFGSADPATGTERLIVLAETREKDPAACAALRDSIVRVTTDVLGEPPDEVVLAPPNTVLKTSSGKLRRSASRELYEAGHVGHRSRSAGWQVVRLLVHAIAPQVRRTAVAAQEFLYAAYASALLVLIATPTWLITSLVRSPARAWAIGRTSARLFFRLSGIGLTVRGLENIAPGTTHVLVANHASYLDGVALVAALPRWHVFVAKHELRGQLVAGTYLRRLGSEFVQRFEAQQSVTDANRLATLPENGLPLALFPEGTFTRAAGLRPFFLGAFMAAARSGVPVVPVAIRGTRAILRSGQWLPRRGTIVVTIGQPIEPARNTDTFSAAVLLRNQARAAILGHCGEPDLLRHA